MTFVYLFFVMLLLGGGYALLRGGAPERLAAGAFFVATALSTGAPRAFAGVEWSLLLIDVGMLVALTALALRADRFWPMWIAAVQLVIVTIHVARAYESGILPSIYYVASARLANVMIVLLAIGTLRYRKRVARYGPEPAWSTWSHA